MPATHPVENDISIDRALKTAFASICMEGLPVTLEIERNCRRVLNGEASIDECIKEMLGQNTAEDTVS